MTKPCECGCGSPAPIAKANDARKNHVKGQPTRFISGHNARGERRSEAAIANMKAVWKDRPRPWLRGPRPGGWGDTPTPASIHKYLNFHFPKRGVCEECGKAGKTDYAFQCHPEPHTRIRSDYREWCRPCHMRFDFDNGTRQGHP